MRYVRNLKQKLIMLIFPLVLLFACLGVVACTEALPERLAVPQNLRVEKKVLYWDEVEYADGYSIYIGNREYITYDCFYDLCELDDLETYPIEVMAFSDRGITHSESACYSYAGRYTIPTAGLQYKFIDSGVYSGTCDIIELAVDDDGVCVIPATYQGRRVRQVRTYETFNEKNEPVPLRKIYSQIKCLCVPHEFFESQGGHVRQDGYWFHMFTNLEKIVLGKYTGDGDPRLVNEGNCIIDTEEKAVVVGCANSVIPEYVTKIAEGAFSGRSGITSFTVPERIKEIERSAFASCTSLESLDLPENVVCERFDIVSYCPSLTKIKVPEGAVNLLQAFYHCYSLREIDLPDSVQCLQQAFDYCTSLEKITVPKGVTKIEPSAFYHCESLKEVVFHEGITEIESRAFDNCVSLKNIVLPEGITKIGEEAFYRCESLKNIVLPEGLAMIGGLAFGHCSSLESVEIPASVITCYDPDIRIGGAFAKCTSLRSVTILGSDTELGYGTFDGCTSLIKVEFPNGFIKDISRGEFKYCTALEFFTVPEGVSLLSAFNNCTALRSVVIPKTQITIGKGAFENCTALTQIFYAGTAEEFAENAKVVDKGNEAFIAATLYYYSETPPEQEGCYWRYVDGVPAPWEQTA